MSARDLRDEVRYLRALLAQRDDYINKLNLRLLSHSWKDYTHVLGYDGAPQRDYGSLPGVPDTQIVSPDAPETRVELNDLDERGLNDREQEAYQSMIDFLDEGGFAAPARDNLEG